MNQNNTESISNNLLLDEKIDKRIDEELLKIEDLLEAFTKSAYSKDIIKGINKYIKGNSKIGKEAETMNEAFKLLAKSSFKTLQDKVGFDEQEFIKTGKIEEEDFADIILEVLFHKGDQKKLEEIMMFIIVKHNDQKARNEADNIVGYNKKLIKSKEILKENIRKLEKKVSEANGLTPSIRDGLNESLEYTALPLKLIKISIGRILRAYKKLFNKKSASVKNANTPSNAKDKETRDAWEEDIAKNNNK